MQGSGPAGSFEKPWFTLAYTVYPSDTVFDIFDFTEFTEFTVVSNMAG